jgi:mannose-1-phosphate guanylyltransferase
MAEVILIGEYEEAAFTNFCEESSSKYGMYCHYIKEPAPRGTGGAIQLIRDNIEDAGDEYFFVIHSDVHCSFPLKSLERVHREKAGMVTMLTAKAES